MSAALPTAQIEVKIVSVPTPQPTEVKIASDLRLIHVAGLAGGASEVTTISELK